MAQFLPIEVAMSADAFIACMFVAAALLAFWVLVRFEHLGPRSLLGAVCGWAASGALIIAIPTFNQGVLAFDLPEARLVIIFGVVLPIFTYFFLAGAWFMRSLMELLNGAR
jgi:hypothetical protein